MPYFVYALADPRNEEIHYIGITDNVYARFYAHLHEKTGSLKTTWIQELRNAKIVPGVKILETVETLKDARRRERYWVRWYCEQGNDLKNTLLVLRPKKAKPKNQRAFTEQRDGDEVMTIQDVALALDLSRETIYRRMHDGLLHPLPYSPLLRKPGRLLFSRREVERFLQESTIA